MALADYILLLDDLARDQGEVLSPGSRERALRSACLQYSNDMPRRTVDDVTFADGQFADVPPGWSADALVQWAEYPIGREPVQLIDLATHLTLTTPEVWQLLAAPALPEGAVVRVTWTAYHQLSESADTIPLVHRLPVAQYAAYLLCLQLATWYSAQRETTLGADASMTETRAREFAARATALRTAYFAGVGLPDPFKAGADSGQAAAAVVRWPSINPRHKLVRRGLL